MVGGGMVLGQRDLRHDSDVLIRQVDGWLARLRAGSDSGRALAERIADVLRCLVVDTTGASAADRARARAAVRYFVVRRNGRNGWSSARSLTGDLRVLNEIVRDLGREDLALPDEPAPLTLPRR